MANIALIRGAGISADRYVSISNAVDRGVRAFETAQQKREAEAEKLRLEKEREELIKAKDYKSLGALQTDGIPEAWRGWYTQQALSVKDENRQLVSQKGSMNQFDYMDSLSNQNKKIAQMQGSINAIKEYSQAYKEISEGGDFSDSLTADEKGLIQDIVQLNGEPVFKDGQMYFKSNTTGQEVSFDDLPELTTKDYETHNKIEKDIISITENAAKNGMFIGSKDGNGNSAYLQSKVDDYFRNLELQPKQAMSLAMDFLKMGGPYGELAPTFRTLTGEKLIDIDGDGDIDKDDYIQSFKNISLPKDFVDRVKEQYKNIAINTSKNLKPEYDRINKVKEKPAYTPYQLFQIAKYNREQEISQNEYLQRAVPAIKKLSNIQSKDDFMNIGKLQAITGIIPKKVGDDYKDYGYESPGIVLGDGKYFISEDMNINDVRQILANAMVKGGLIQAEEVNDILSAIKPFDEEKKIDPQVGILPQTQLNINKFN